MTWDKLSDLKITLLDKYFAHRVETFINMIEEHDDKRIRVTAGLRTYRQQQILYDKWRKTNGQIVTHATAGYSYHNFGLAVDVCQIKSGNAIFNFVDEYILILATELDLTWGGTFSFHDNCHFQDSNYKSIYDVRKAFISIDKH